MDMIQSISKRYFIKIMLRNKRLYICEKIIYYKNIKRKAIVKGNFMVIILY